MMPQEGDNALIGDGSLTDFNAAYCAETDHKAVAKALANRSTSQEHFFIW